MYKAIRNLVALAAVATLMSTQARADDQQFLNDRVQYLFTGSTSYTSHNPGMTVEIDFNGDEFDTRAGIFNLAIPGLRAVCVELDQIIHANTNYNFDVWIAYGRAGSLLRMMDSFVVDNTTAAAFQIAMWEIAYDHAAGNADDLTSGIFEYTDNATIMNLANGLLSAANQSKQYIYLRSDETQDLVLVPEPASLTALGIGLVGALLRRRRKS